MLFYSDFEFVFVYFDGSFWGLGRQTQWLHFVGWGQPPRDHRVTAARKVVFEKLWQNKAPKHGTKKSASCSVQLDLLDLSFSKFGKKQVGCL